MIIRLTSDDICRHWESIKYAAVSANAITGTKVQEYAINLLKELLTNKYQCWVAIKDDNIIAICVTKFMLSMGGSSHLFIEAVYAFGKPDANERQEFIKTLIEFAMNNGCDRIMTFSQSPIGYDALLNIGFTERGKIYCMDIRK